jgi:membrane associated rhomboid family serine protease
MDTDHNASPINPLPPVVWLLAVPIALIEIGFGLGSRGLVGGPAAVGWRLDAIERFAFMNTVFDWMLENRSYPPEYLMRFVTYPFVHGSFTHALFVVVFILALGKMVGEIFKPWAVLAVFFGSGIVGALVYGLVLDDPYPLLGGYPPVYGLIGAFTFLLWVNLAAKGANKLRAFTLIGFLLATQLLFALLFGGNNQWVADVAGFAAGFLLSFLVSPGGWGRALQQIRGR